LKISFNNLGQYIPFILFLQKKGNIHGIQYNPWKIILSLCTITALISALLDNVTTVLLIVPMTFVITETLELDPIPFLIPEILASNIGGTSTLIVLCLVVLGLVFHSQVGYSSAVVALSGASILPFVATLIPLIQAMGASG
jgi:Na+/H+ antiporter NhaD/arsenite permease-like protein